MKYRLLPVPVLLLVWSGILSAPEYTHAQGQFFLDETLERLPVREDRSRDGVPGDFNGDNYLDIVISTPDVSSFRPYYICNDGSGVFPESSLQDLFVVPYNFPAVAAGDIERDGDLDLLFPANGDKIRLLANDAGQFTDESDERLPLHGDRFAYDGALVDVDGDLLLDVVFVEFGGVGVIWMNMGEGYFDFANPGQLPTGFIYSTEFVWGDVDGDLDVDCVIANNTGYANMLMINDGSGWFSDQTGERLPIDTSPTNGITLVDVDGDKDLDIVVGSGTPPGYNQIWINDGTGHFTDESERLPYVWDTTLGVTSGDVDNDGDIDLLIANNGYNNRFNRLLVNNGRGYFTDETNERYPFVEETTETMLPGDVDLDGDLDCLVVNFGESSDPFSGQNRLLINQSTPDSFPPTIPRTYHHPDTGDTTNPYLITTTVWDNISVVIGELEVSLLYRAIDDTVRNRSEEGFLKIPMLDCGGFLYRERIPAQPSGTTVEYYIKAEDKMGNISYDPPNAPDSVYSFLVDVSVGVNDDPSFVPLPKTFSLSQNYPNPFNPSTTIDYSVPEGEVVKVKLLIYDLRGKLVRTLVNEQKSAGSYSVHWDGRNNGGRQVGSGVYLYRIESGIFTSTRKMTILR